MLSNFSVFEKLWKVFIRNGKSNFIYNLIHLNFIYLKHSFRILFLKKIYKKNIYFFYKNRIFFFFNIFYYKIFNPFFLLNIITFFIKPNSLLISKIVRGDVKRMPIFFNIYYRSFFKGIFWISVVLKEYSIIRLKPNFLKEIFSLYFRKSKVFLLKNSLYFEVIKSRENLKFF